MKRSAMSVKPKSRRRKLEKQKTIGKFVNRTYINQKLLPYTRIFSSGEMHQWIEEDQDTHSNSSGIINT